MEFNEILQIRLRSKRKEKKLSQEELAKRVNTTKATISNYENGYSTPPNEMLIKLANELDVTTDWLLGRTEAIQVTNTNIKPIDLNELMDIIRHIEEADEFRVLGQKVDNKKKQIALDFFKEILAKQIIEDK